MPIEFYVKKVPLKNSILITGFHGLGATGFITVKHAVTSLNAELIGYIDSERIPPFVSMDDGRLSLPFEIYKHDKYVFILTNVPPHTKERQEFSRSLAEWAIKEHFSASYLIGGLDSRLRPSENDKIRCAVTKSFKNLSELGAPLLEKGLFVVGPLAIMLAHFEINSFPAIALLPYANPARPDPMAAAVAIEYINKLTNLNIDASQLISDARRIEAEIQELMKQRQERVKTDHRTLYI
ncbi:MAG: proteasome assembly chaperone family protein [Candidatus Methanomethyliales bacterium]|nr:proteasome assembly chaperone family protein [Candidatus Methanomethylicales archaeon]